MLGHTGALLTGEWCLYVPDPSGIFLNSLPVPSLKPPLPCYKINFQGCLFPLSKQIADPSMGTNCNISKHWETTFGDFWTVSVLLYLKGLRARLCFIFIHLSYLNGKGTGFSHLLVHSLDNHNCLGWVRLKMGAWNSIWVAESQLFKSFSAVSKRAH